MSAGDSCIISSDYLTDEDAHKMEVDIKAKVFSELVEKSDIILTLFF